MINIKEGINYGTGLIYDDLVSYNIISYSIKRGQYKLVRFIFEEYELGKKKNTTFNNQYNFFDNIDNYMFENDLFCQVHKLLLILFREHYGLLYFMIKKRYD